MAFKHLTREFYDALVAAFREAPGNYSAAAKRANCNRETSKRAWEFGNPRYPWARPIKDVLAEEAEAARALSRRLELEKLQAAEDERRKAREDAAQQLAQEANMLKAGRANVLSSLLSAGKMLPGIQAVANKLQQDLQQGALLTPKDALRALRDFSLMVRNLVVSASQLIEAERQRRGEPTDVLGIQVSGEITVEEAVSDIEELGSLVELARERGLLKGPVTMSPSPKPEGGNGSGSNGTTH